MKIVFTRHALEKFRSLVLLGWRFTQKDIREALINPDYSFKDEERDVWIILKEIDNEHNLRVIYKEDGDIITVITFYPREKGRL